MICEWLKKKGNICSPLLSVFQFEYLKLSKNTSFFCFPSSRAETHWPSCFMYKQIPPSDRETLKTPGFLMLAQSNSVVFSPKINIDFVLFAWQWYATVTHALLILLHVLAMDDSSLLHMHARCWTPIDTHVDVFKARMGKVNAAYRLICALLSRARLPKMLFLKVSEAYFSVFFVIRRCEVVLIQKASAYGASHCWRGTKPLEIWDVIIRFIYLSHFFNCCSLLTQATCNLTS